MESQYKTSTNLESRIGLHERFSTNKYDWHRWVFDHLELPTSARILEIGCGTGRLWVANQGRIPENWSLTLTDSSEGMIEKTRQSLEGLRIHPQTIVADASSLPFDNATFDAVVANHVMYHITDKDKAFSEVERVLRPGGRFYAATNGITHMQELFQMLYGSTDRNVVIEGNFSLENGRAQLEKWFSDVKLYKFESSLEVTDAQALIDYVFSMSSSQSLAPEQKQEFISKIKEQIAREGSIHITKSTGLFETKNNV